MAWVAVAVGVGTGAVLGAVAGSAKGGDAIWQGALGGAIAGGVTGGLGTYLAPTLGGVGAGALAGGVGGALGGVTNAALGGGDIGLAALYGGLGGAAMGGLTGAMGGFDSAAASGVPSEASGAIAAGPETGAPTLADAASGQIGTPAQSLTTDVPVPTSSAGIDIGATPAQQYAAAPTTSMTDIGGSSAIPQQLPGGYTAPEGSFTAATPEQFQGFAQSGAQNAQSGMNAFNLGGADMAEGSTMAPITGASMAPATQVMNQSPTSFMDSISNWWNKPSSTSGKSMDMGNYLKMAGMSQLMKGGVNTLGALATRGETQQNRAQLMDLYNQQMAQNQAQANAANQYQGQLQQTYTNPQSYLSSPEAQATRSAALNDIMRKNAAAGRRSVGIAAQNQLLQTQMANLGAYRQGLRGAIQYPTGYGTAAQIANYGQAYSPTADIFGGISSALTPASLAYLYR